MLAGIEFYQFYCVTLISDFANISLNTLDETGAVKNLQNYQKQMEITKSQKMWLKVLYRGYSIYNVTYNSLKNRLENRTREDGKAKIKGQEKICEPFEIV